MGVWVKIEVSVPGRHLCVTVTERVEIEQFALHEAFSRTHASVHPSVIYASGRARLPFSVPGMQRWEEEKSQSIQWARRHREITVWFDESPHGCQGPQKKAQVGACIWVGNV